MRGRITLIKSTNPATVCKTFRMDDFGTVQKGVVANINEGTAKSVHAATTADMVRILRLVTNRHDIAICAGVWHKDVPPQIGADGEKFDLYCENALAEMLGKSPGTGPGGTPGGIVKHDGRRVAARLKRGIYPSEWVLLDADNPPGIPTAWASLDIAGRLELFDAILPGISECERIELRSSSARVDDGSGGGTASHAWIKVSDAQKVALMRAYVSLEMVNTGLSFTFEKKSRDTGDTVALEPRTLFDLAVWDTGRLVFCAKPDVQMAGYSVADAAITVVNEGAGPLNINWIETPTPDQKRAYRMATGHKVDVKIGDHGGVSIANEGQLTLCTEITSKGVTRSLGSWASTMSVGDKMRCEAPFRASESEAAFVGIHTSGNPFVYDIGCGTSYRLARIDPPHITLDLSRKADNEPGKPKRPKPEPTGGLDDWVFLSCRNLFFNEFTGEEMNAQSLNLAFARTVPTFTDDKGKETRPSAVVYFRDHLEGRVAYERLYMPALAGKDAVFEHNNIRYVNSYLAQNTPAEAEDWRGNDAWLTCQEHIENILPDDYADVLRWMAYCVQNPGRKVLWAPIIKGVPGDGKTTIFKMIRAAMGPRNTKIVSTESLMSDFTAWAEGACVVSLEEIRVKGHNRHDAMNKLKPMITNDTVDVVKKGMNGFDAPNVTNYLALTNYEDALVLDADDRRWGVFFTRFQDREELLRDTDDAYWDKLHNAIDNNPGVIRGWLLSFDLADFNPNRSPELTSGKREMIANSLSTDAAEVAARLDIGAIGVCRDVVTTSHLNDAMHAFSGSRLNTSRLAVALAELGFVKRGRVRWNGGPIQPYVAKSALNDLVARGVTDDERIVTFIKMKLDETKVEHGGLFAVET